MTAGAVTGLAVRQVRRGALLVAGFAAGTSALVAGMYERTVGDALDAAALAALARNPAIRTMFGEPVALHTAGGFTVWRTGTVLAVLLSVWAILTATRLTRGEEDAGRWDLLLAGRLRIVTLVSRSSWVVAGVVVAAGAATAGALVAAGTPVSGAAVYGGGLALTGLFFTAAAVLAAQLLPSRAAATSAAVTLLGAGLLTRMVGDGVEALRWLRWGSPFGLTALSRPFDGDATLPLLVLAAATAGLVVLAAVAAGRRDLRDAVLPARPARRSRLRSVRSVGRFAVRRLSRVAAGWAAGLGAYYLLVGLLAVEMTRFLRDNPRFAQLAAEAGFPGLGSVDGYVASLFAVLGVPVGLFAAVRLAAFAEAESDRRLVLLCAGPVTRWRLLRAEAAVTAAAAAALPAVAGLAVWAGAAVAGAGLPVTAALAGAVNVVPVALLSLGAAVWALGWAPKLVGVLGAVPSAGGFLLQAVADSVGAPAWVGRLSPFAHLAPVPQEPPNWPAAAVMLALAGGLVAAGVFGYQRRDLRG